MHDHSTPVRPSEPVVSVIMIFYNSQRFMAEAVESILMQDFDEWELLLTDDGSTDGSSEIARKCASTDPARIRYLEHENHVNRGTSATRNFALRHARGRYVIMIDSDDAFKSAVDLREQVSMLDAHPDVAAVYGPNEIWNSWQGSGVDRAHPLGFSDVTVAPPFLLARFLVHGVDAPPHCAMMRREAVLAVGGYDEAIRDFGEDFILSIKLALRYPFHVSSRCWYRYRIHPGSFTFGVRADGSHAQAQARLFEWIREYFMAEGVADRRLWRAWRKASWPFRHPRLQQALLALAAETKWIRTLIRVALPQLYRRLSGGRNGSLVVRPPVTLVKHRGESFVVEVLWLASGGGPVEVHVLAPDGPLFASIGPIGAQHTGPWAKDQTVFFLQDGAAESPRSPAATLAVARVRAKLTK